MQRLTPENDSDAGQADRYSRAAHITLAQDLDYAVVAGIDLNGLGVVRSLARAGVPVIAVDTDLTKPTAQTRFGIKWPFRALSGDMFIDDLVALRERLTRDPVLFLTQEASVATVSAERDRIGAYRIALPPDSVIRNLSDKAGFQRVAERYGFPIPKAVPLAGDGNFDSSVLGHLRYPCVLKPATKNAEFVRRFGKACKVATSDQALAIWQAAAGTRLILQEWIEGDDADIYFCLQYRTAKGPVASFVGRKLLQWPPLVGGTASCMSGDEFAGELESLTNSFFEATGFVGLGGIEYKRDRRDRKFYMVEPTVGRTDLQEEVATLNGVNIPLAAYRSELALAVSHGAGRPRVWRDPVACALARGAGAVAPAIQRHVRTSDAYFRIDDPEPYIALKVEAARNKFSRVVSLATGARWTC